MDEDQERPGLAAAVARSTAAFAAAGHAAPATFAGQLWAALTRSTPAFSYGNLAEVGWHAGQGLAGLRGAGIAEFDSRTRARRPPMLVPLTAAFAVLVIAVVTFVAGEHFGRHQIPGPAPVPLSPYGFLADPSSTTALDSAFSSDGKLLAVADQNGSLYLWRPGHGTLVARLRHRGSLGMSAVAFSPGGRTLAAGTGNGAVYLWDPARRKLRAILRCPGAGSITSIAYTPDGRNLAAGGSSSRGVTCLWNLSAAIPPTRLESPGKSRISGVAFSPDGNTLAVATGTPRSYLWDPFAHRILGQLANPGHSHVSSVAFSPDGKLLATGASDGNVYLWNTSTHRAIWSMADPGKTGGVTAVAFSADGNTLAAADSNGDTYLRNVTSGTLIAILPDPQSRGVTSVTFSSDRKTIATTDRNGWTYLWTAPPSATPEPVPTTPPPSASLPTAFLQAQSVNNLLARSSGSLDRLNNAIALANQCQNLPVAVSQIRQAASGRQAELSHAQALQTGALANGSQLKSDLIKALQYSLQADNDYLTWAQQQKASCVPGSSGTVGISDGSNAGATKYKMLFLNLWNPLASQYGFPVRSST